MRIANKILPHYTIEDWKNWEGTWELIEGHPIAMSPSPVPEHQRIAAEMTAELIIALRRSQCKKCRVYHPMDYVITDDTIVVPDILVVCKEIIKKQLDFPPSLVVEILSPSTALRDRNTKYELYQQQKIPYYLVVDIVKKEIDVFSLKNNTYEIETGANRFNFQLEDCTIAPDFSNLFT